MKKLLFLLTTILAFSSASIAQEMRMSVYLSSLLIPEKHEPESQMNLGGGLAFDYYFNPYIRVGGSFSYWGYFSDALDNSVNVLPLQLVFTGNYPVTENFSLYAGGGAGFFLQRYKSSTDLVATEVIWGVSPGVGLAYEFAEDVFLDFGANYVMSLTDNALDNVDGIIYINLGLGYRISAF